VKKRIGSSKYNFKPGDKFIRISPLGTKIIGQVKDIKETFVIDLESDLIYVRVYIITTNNISYFLDGSDGTINKIVGSKMSPELKENLKKLKKK
jgi:hypothetical protein